MKSLQSALQIKKATLADYPTIQNMARFYVYDLSRECGFISEDWACPADGLYESFDFRHYFVDSDREAWLLKVGEELAGFVLLDKEGFYPDTRWNMGEFFIFAKFQGKGIARETAFQIWKMHAGLWKISVIPENRRALSFWRKTISEFTEENYQECTEIITYDVHQPKRIIFHFNTDRPVDELEFCA